ncbi:unnamed protein product [Albugo candida]|nr:unnamed protein product [Albugo candida]|eukprot:CCI40641.1 unnamed protein product [Albugo candida]
MGCRMCDSDDSCRQISGDSASKCSKGLKYESVESRMKTYHCQLHPSIVVTQVDMACNRTARTCQFYAFEPNRTQLEMYYLSCNLTDCNFKTGSSDGECGVTQCKCGKSCTAMTRQLISSMINGKPVGIVTSGSDTLTVDIKDSPIPLRSTCTASACENTSTSAAAGNHRSMNGWLIAIIVVCVILMIGLVLFFAYVRWRKTYLEQQEHVEGAKLSMFVRGDAHVFQFRNIGCRTVAPSFLGKKSNTPEKIILHGISGQLQCGKVMGLLGPSGSGKSSLLNTLAGVSNGSCEITGEVLIDQHKITKSMRKTSAYVHQDVTLFSTLTVRECITYSAQLRLSPRVSESNKKELIESIISELNLHKVADSRIGSSDSKRGISGGEQRRVGIGMELVTSPQMIFLDEPTSGLDSASANSLVQLIRRLADHGRIIIMSIHQPSVDSFLALDRIMLLAEGRLLYQGAPLCAKAYFEARGYEFPENGSIAEYLLNIASKPEGLTYDPSTVEIESVSTTLSSRSNEFKSSEFDRKQFDSIDQSPLEEARDTAKHCDVTNGYNLIVTTKCVTKKDIDAAYSMERSRLMELRVLFWRSGLNLIRHRSLFQLHMLLSVLLGLVGGFIFNHVTDDLAGFQNRSGAFYFILTFFGFASLSSMDIFLAERSIFIRETGALYYTPSSYFIAKSALDSVFLRILPATAFGCIFYWIMGLQAESSRFLLFLLTVVLFNLCAGSITIFVGTVTRSVGVANLVSIIILLVMLLFGGFLLNNDTMPGAVAWLKHISAFNYGFETLMTNELRGIVLTFNAPGYPSIPIYGDVFLKTMKLYYSNRYYDVLALAVLTFAFQIGALNALTSFSLEKDQLDPDGSPESVFLQKNDIILVRHRAPTSSIARPLVNDDEYFSRMKELLSSGENSDVVIEAGPERASFPAHRSILSARCEFFRAMLRPGAMKESTAGVVRITNHSAEMVSKMLEFIYTNRVSDLHKLGYEQLIELLTLAEQYLLVSLRCACEAAAQELLNLVNIGKFLVAAENHNANYLKEACLQFFVEYRHEILQDDAFREEVENCPTIAFQLLKVLAQNMPLMQVAPIAVCSTISTESSKRRRLCMPSDEEEISRDWT